jgi:NurA domain
MPYEGEYAGYRSVRRLVGPDAVQQLLKRARVAAPHSAQHQPSPSRAPDPFAGAPDFVVGIDGSYSEVPVKNGYPGAYVGYCTVASVLIDLKLIDRLDEERPVDPQLFRKTEEAATVDAALPGSNVVTRNHTAARDAFREAVFDVLHDKMVDEDDKTRLLDTYEALLAEKPQGHSQSCPYDHLGCDRHITIPRGNTTCPCGMGKAIYSTDALRIHERFGHDGTNGEAFGLVSEVWGKLLLVHLLRCVERQGMLEQLRRMAFVLDGPLGVFGPPAWLSAAISTELKRINGVFRQKTGTDLLILGIEKTGTFVAHFDEIDQTDKPGTPRFDLRTYLMLTDKYIKSRISLSDSQKRYGVDTYFGRKFFYKTSTGGRIVASIPFLTEEEDTLDTDDVSLYPQFGSACALLDKLASNRYPNAVTPLVSAHAEAAIPLELGHKVLQQLAKALMRRD